MKHTIAGHVRAYDVDGRGAATLASILHYAEDARLALASALAPEGVRYPLRNLARAQHVVVTRPLPMLAAFRATSSVIRVGGSSFDVGTLLEHEGTIAASVRITFVVVDEARAKTAVDASMRAAVTDLVAPLGPGLPEVSAPPRYVRVYPVLPRDENSGRHVSHARLVEHASEHLRLAASEGALDPAAGDAVRALSIVYEREVRFPDALRVSLTGAGGAYEAELTRATGEVVARARFATR